jgi:hypothetical protein
MSLIAVAVLAMAAGANADVIAYTGFDGTTDVNVNDATYNPAPAAWYYSDLWGPMGRSYSPGPYDVGYDALDDSLTYSADNFGIIPTGKTDNVFLIEDLNNSDNSSGTGTATWSFDISSAQGGLTDVTIDFAAMGDFENTTDNDEYNFSYRIDGGTWTSLYTITAEEDQTLQYYMESGAAGQELDDPLSIDGTIVDNDLTPFTSTVVNGLTGSTLEIKLEAGTNGGYEVFAFDDITVNGTVPEPATMSLLALGGLALLRRRK